MARQQKISFTIAGCLIFGFNLARAQGDFQLGKITQSSGTVTFLEFTPPHKLSEITTDALLSGSGSYLTQETAYFTAKLFDGSWIRVSPKTKFALEFDPEKKNLTLNLFSGSVKVLFAHILNNKQVTTFTIRSADAVFETSEAKFTVVRNILTTESTLFVEKGVVTARLSELKEGKDSVIVHTREMTSLRDRTLDFHTPKQMGDREMKFLNSAFYLGGKKEQELE
jgi:hypothetical protein